METWNEHRNGQPRTLLLWRRLHLSPQAMGRTVGRGVVELLEDRESRGKTRAIETRSKN
uniref:Uncharacterized protein n=1 Tax=Candidatus Kentrum sp. UNK TaxID=2126344 RepID=A0A451ANJ5_9GAMM|nr:MAG: hypothetical protein BECKUNK1418G_GA0071005_11534 [Candidatus Kentron sp. UNK]VFK72864.1 MAG: hypothetical protein BECKUNK1418H_GA0071006_11454 [Candidatus Kentron sp. UNK]